LDGLKATYNKFLEDHVKLFKALNVGSARGYEFPEKDLRAYYRLLQTSGVASEILHQYELRFLRVPLSSVLKHFQDLAENVASRLGKKLHPLQFDTAEVRVNPQFLESLLGSMVHAFRNAVDHGIEPAEDREMMGKDPAGRIRVQASYMKDDTWARIVVEDDGGGMDPRRLAARAQEKIPGIDTASMKPEEIFQLVFHPGFSSRDQVSEFSGRGVGMDAIRYEVQTLGGKVWMESTLGQGSRLCMEIPITDSKAPVAKAA
jgi:two-component system chemotaxis sensor kinase CheA